MRVPKIGGCLMVLAGMAMAGCADFKIVANNRPQAEIVLPKNAGDKLKKDVAYFNACLEKSAKTGLPVVTNRTSGKNAILFNVIPMKLADDDTFTIEFPIAFPGAATMRITCSERSSRWALNHILQEQAGVLPLYRGETFYPSLTNLSIPRQTVTRSASFNLRREPMTRVPEAFEGWNGKAEVECIHWLARDVFPATKYARNQSWPAEIMPVIGGKKVVLPPPKANTPDDKLWEQYCQNWQPCWSNPKTADIAVANILELLAAHPEIKSISLGINDNGNDCECKVCAKAVGNKSNSIGMRDYSELYYAWVNKVAEKVAEKHPDMYFPTIAYREMMDPPGFKLHPKVAVGLCFDSYATIDAEVHKKRWGLINAWSEKTAILGIGDDYAYGSYWYAIPRIYYKHHAQYIKDFYRKGGRTFFFEEWMRLPDEGPKYYLMMKLLWDVNADPEKLINEWITACVGAQAAPYLRQYYQFWEDYWTGADIRKTKWFEKKNAIYMQEGSSITYTFALKKGDMARCRQLMEQVVANAGTPDQKRRASYLMTLFEKSEKTTTGLFSGIIPPNGRLDSAAQALEILQSVPAAIKAIGGGASLANNLSVVSPFLNDPAVKAALTALAAQPDMTPLLRGQFKLWLGQPATNLLANGSFESEAPLPQNAKRVQQYKHSGAYALITANGTLTLRVPVQAGKTYLVAARVFIPKSSTEGLFGMRLAPGVDDLNAAWQEPPATRLTAGQWNLISSTIQIPSKGYSGVPNRLDLYLDCRNFEKNERVYIDDVMVIELDEPKAVKAGP